MPCRRALLLCDATRPASSLHALCTGINHALLLSVWRDIGVQVPPVVHIIVNEGGDRMPRYSSDAESTVCVVVTDSNPRRPDLQASVEGGSGVSFLCVLALSANGIRARMYPLKFNVAWTKL